MENVKQLFFAITVGLTMGLASPALLAQDALWVLSETPPSVGKIDLTSFTYEEMATFEDVAYATDLEIRGEEAVVVLENRVVKIDLATGQTLADTELLGAQEACILDDGTVVITRGGVNDAWEPLDLTSHLVWLDGQDLSWEGELTPSEGPSMPSQEVTVVDGIVYVAVNNGWSYTQEVGRMGRWDPLEGTYEEWDLGEAAQNPVAIHVHDGALFTVNNGDWTSTSVSRVALDDLTSVETVALQGVSAGCNASAFVESKLAVQISGESGLRLLDSPTMAWEEGEVLNQAAPSAYSLAVHPQYGWTFAGVTDYATFGEVQIRTTTGEILATVPVGISPGTLVWQDTETSDLDKLPIASAPQRSGTWDVMGRETGPARLPGMPALTLVRRDNGTVDKVMQVGQ